VKLYGYYRSSTSYRLRIALHLKKLTFENIPVNLLSGEQKGTEFLKRNPFGTVPVLEADGQDYVQSMAIIEWLEERFTDHPLLPQDIDARFDARELAYAIATELHAPLNLSVLNYLKQELGHDQDAVKSWYHHWLEQTLSPVEQKLAARGTGNLLFDRPGLFETVLIPQIYNAKRFGFDLSRMPHITQIDAHCQTLEVFQLAHPDAQPDGPKPDHLKKDETS